MFKHAVVQLPLHGGKAPPWLLSRMKLLGRAIVDLLVDEFGPDGLLDRIADPFWFQALTCVLAYDWHSSGTTTVMCGVLKSIIDPAEHGILIAGGKGGKSRETPTQIATGIDKVGAPGEIATYQRASRLCAKVDSTALQDGYQLYHHCFFLAKSGRWAVIQQGMNEAVRFARRYHWNSGLTSFVKDPHQAILSGTGKPEQGVVNLVDNSSEECQHAIIDQLQDGSPQLLPTLKRLEAHAAHQRTLFDWAAPAKKLPPIPKLVMDQSLGWVLPKKINWNAVRLAAEVRPHTFEDALLLKGLGPAAFRGLSLVSALVYGAPPSFRDPVKYSFAFGGKDGVPYPVNRRGMEETARVMQRAIRHARLGNKDETRTLRRLANISTTWEVETIPRAQQPGLPRWDPT